MDTDGDIISVSSGETLVLIEAHDNLTSATLLFTFEDAAELGRYLIELSSQGDDK